MLFFLLVGAILIIYLLISEIIYAEHQAQTINNALTNL